MEIWRNIDALEIEDFDELKLGDSGTLFPIRPSFFVPPLEEKPQDPIVRALKLSEINRNLPPRAFNNVRPLPELVAPQEPTEPPSVEEFWRSLVEGEHHNSNRTVSWDRLRETFPQSRTSTAFLSEQEPLVLSAARQHINPKFDDKNVKFVYVTEEEFRQAIRMVVIGTSSTLFKWDHHTDRFVQVGLEPGQVGHVAIDGTDEVISKSLLSRFLSIGTHLRRLEEFIKTLNQSMVKAGPTVHAFAHSLSSTLMYLRTVLVRLASDEIVVPPAASWMKYAVYEEILDALAELYGRPENIGPESYRAFEPSPITIISTIYQHLSSHYERQSPREVVAIFAYILDTTSKEYLHQVGISVGYGGQPIQQLSKVEDRPEDYYPGLDEEDEEEDIFEALEQIQHDFPEFFPKPLLDILPAAQKSLILLKKAQPDHELLSSEESAKKRIRWLWTEDQITAAWSELESSRDSSASRHARQPSPDPERSYPPEFSEFHVYDLEPGIYVGTTALQAVDRTTSALSTFIANFPSQLPAITPTLPHLTFLVFRKLLDHSATLSSTLLSLFLSSSGNLNFRLHLELLRSYLLVTAPGFKTRLTEALFSDAGEYEIDNTAHSMSMRSIRRRPSRRFIKESKQPWAVGISSNLLEREIWPPVSGDLSFFLRTVIVDSLNLGKRWEDEEARKSRHIILEEAIWRIGFAIRDLPVGSGKDKWLNPLYIEALDFLYMDYKPPRPMDILISHDILHKYQRIFAFILRLLRVESALKSVFRIARGTRDPTFQNLPQYRKLFLHFRFIAQSFVASLSSYVFDTAIGGNFDPFLARLSPKPPSESGEASSDFTDVFELAEAHSNLLDDILSACLLRTGQKAVSELMRHSLEIVLEFCVVVGELHRKRMKEYEAAPVIEDLYGRFRGKMGMLTKVLKGLVDKGPSSSKLPIEVQMGENRPTGGAVALYHLLLRLDLGDWWAKGKLEK
ncbi:hypothetical protein CC1G_14255 [Coprinopsis cinerea okayama7|uniref:Spindle pole body component n=1 Tax=Coprinopsis cinerea (strain Okayama-7 / 130 / ATCC MYA-4618 / FGSC 9003) TaxID=240176 RepID=D6RLE6_COPC7|nr:hypothetical protein CC1G_14255 [Coprinopsis cinerea okayama7\|eukprot:XP_002911724.1 hypothetical protein CC1G_14255 [Coprinopsis cinerea okayama7\